uniref:Uncharacterized protein n=1 Tax=Setaria italica TaxID=4555 RepID=K3ZPF7_SETIT
MRGFRLQKQRPLASCNLLKIFKTKHQTIFSFYKTCSP